MRKTLIVALLTLVAGNSGFAKDHSNDYKLGTYLSARSQSDGTITDNINCGTETLGSTVCSGGIAVNGVVVYQIQVADGIWSVETERQAGDAMIRQTLGQVPVHFKAEKTNPLDLLKNQDKVMFRAEDHRKLNGVEHNIFIPFADNPSKEAKFVGWFTPTKVPVMAVPPSDNIAAMCSSGKLSAELKIRYCNTPASDPPQN